jgi:ATP-dependent Clp protease protease subunit
MSNLVPYVIENTKDGERVYDVYSRLLKDRIIFLGTEITDEVANSTIAQLLLLNNQNKTDIEVYINSPGGSVTAGLAILDTMNFIKADIRTICIGQACSMGSKLLAAGTKGKRFSLPNSRVMIHGVQGHTSGGSLIDQQIWVEEMNSLNNKCMEILAINTGQPLDSLVEQCKRDTWMSAEEAKDFGIIDQIIVNQEGLDK